VGLAEPDGRHEESGKQFARKGLVISDRDGASFVIHALSDDEHTDPSGNRGGRIACAVVAAPLGR